MNYQQNGYPENWDDRADEYGTEEVIAEFDDDDDESLVEFDDDDDESIEAEYDDDDDEVAAEFDDDDDESAAEFDDDDDESQEAGELLGFSLIGKGLKGIRRLVNRRRRSRSYRNFRPRNFLRHRLGRGRFRVPSRSNIRGTLRLGRRRFPFKLPSNLATKTDVKRLASQVRKDIRLNGIAIKKNAAGIRTAIGLARKANKGVANVDKKYRSATLRQNQDDQCYQQKGSSLEKSPGAQPTTGTANRPCSLC